MNDRPLDLVTYGEAMVEFDELERGHWRQGVGGDTLNVAVAARRAGATVGFAGALGQDTWGDAILATCKSEKVETDAVLRDPDHPTGLYFVTHDALGHHFSYRRKGSAASHYGPDDAFRSKLNQAKCLHFSGISLAISSADGSLAHRLVSEASNAGTKISFDPNFRARLWSPEKAKGPVVEAMRAAHILLPGLDDMRDLFGLSDIEEALSFCASLAPDVIVLKNGGHDIHIVDPSGRYVVTPPRVEAKDANGAGDCFDGFFLAAFLSGRSPVEAAHEAASQAAQSTLKRGAQGDYSRAAAVSGF